MRQTTLKLTDQKKKTLKPQISILFNCKKFNVDIVYIAKEEGRYRLIVLLKGKFIKNDYYHALNGAKLAFQRSFGRDKKKIKPVWSQFFKPKKESLYYAFGKSFISNLMSSEYFLETVFIMAIQEGYRLIVIHRDLILDKTFKNFEQASKAFYDQFKNKAYNNVKPLWTEFYPPSLDWLDKKLSIAREV